VFPQYNNNERERKKEGKLLSLVKMVRMTSFRALQ
jgi:hypothetical protein